MKRLIYLKQIGLRFLTRTKMACRLGDESEVAEMYWSTLSKPRLDGNNAGNHFRKSIHIALICLLLIGVAGAQINELLPMPALLVSSASRVAQVVEEAKQEQYSPLSLADYQSGVYNLPRNAHAFILVMPSENHLVSRVRSNQNLNLPMYHQNFDPVQRPRVFAIANSFKDWVNRPTANTFVSDGDPLEISIPISFQAELFTYAPTSGMVIRVPGALPFTTKSLPYSSKTERWAQKKVSTRGLHVTYEAIRTPQKTVVLIRQMASGNVETLVIDFKTYIYPIQLSAYPTFKSFMDEPVETLVTRCRELGERIALLKQNHINVSLRMVVALDFYVDEKRPEMLLWNRKTNSPWKASNGATWVDLFCPDTLQYYTKLATLAARLQADELQLDYVRFPTEGDMEALFSRYGGGRPRYQAVDGLLKQLVTITDQYQIGFSADIFGIVLWENQTTNEHLGQNLLTFMRYVDAVCPMTYPSHFHDGFDGIAKPGDEPFLFNQQGGLRFKAIASRYPQYAIKFVPWIQAFKYRSPTYSPLYVKEELRALKETGMNGYLAWNAANDYETFFKGLQLFGTKNIWAP